MMHNVFSPSLKSIVPPNDKDAWVSVSMSIRRVNELRHQSPGHSGLHNPQIILYCLRGEIIWSDVRASAFLCPLSSSVLDHRVARTSQRNHGTPMDSQWHGNGERKRYQMWWNTKAFHFFPRSLSLSLSRTQYFDLRHGSNGVWSVFIFSQNYENTDPVIKRFSWILGEVIISVWL